MEERIFIADMEPGDRQDAVYRISNFSIQTDRNGNDYASFTASDCTGEMDVKMFDVGFASSVMEEERLSQGGLARFSLQVKSLRGKLAGETKMIRPVDDAIDDYVMADLFEEAPEKAEEMWNELYDMAGTFAHADLGRVVQEALLRRKDLLLYIPGGKRMHHNVRSGLLYHMVRMARTGKAIAGVYPEVDGDLLAAGAIVHDLGKMDEFILEPDTGAVVDYTPEGDLLNHNITGIFLIRDIVKDLDADPEVFRLLSHMIESHHGLPERGSAVPPKFMEADLLRHLDEIDSRIWIFDREYDYAEPGKISPRLSRSMDIHVYRPDLYKENEEPEN